ncbi:MAG TPA: bifunctional DNA-formamidopyrimidine glycosylase/DNA-(apurinic or apyrimidinic site) lyase [Ktedonobacterales bacterium]|nr:bifunctional DNA-formamidopyrimidine glycosylase/DNA-(apurinic or apyrimidinic site) lyase [Ktedonobacterales bacterium]
MPELAEVEYVARQLRAETRGRRIVAAHVYWARSIQGIAPDAFEAGVVGRVITEVGRRAKYLLVTLQAEQREQAPASAHEDTGDARADDPDTRILIIHRRMSGNVLLAKPDEIADGVTAFDPYTRVDFALDDGRHLVYSDPRKFGRLALVAPDALPDFFAAIGPEPLDDAFTAARLGRRLASHNGAIKAVLLDQSVVAGLGNIYADEALYRARIHPLRHANTLTETELQALRDAIRSVLETGIVNGGVTFGRHRGIYNEAGANLAHLEVYRHTGQPCLRCGAPIQRIVVVGRGTHFCPACQL